MMILYWLGSLRAIMGTSIAIRIRCGYVDAEASYCWLFGKPVRLRCIGFVDR